MVEYISKSVKERLENPRDGEECEVLVTFTEKSEDAEQLTSRADVEVKNEIPAMRSVAYAVVIQLPESALKDVVAMDAVRSVESNKGLKIQPANIPE